MQVMQEVPGIPGALPPLAPYPGQDIRASLPFQEWQACIDSWIFCTEIRLRLADEHFISLKLSHSASGFPFLLSYLRELARSQQKNDQNGLEAKESQLRRNCFFLLRRLLLDTKPPLECSSRALYELLAN